MNCTRVPMPGGGVAIVCGGRGRAKRLKCYRCPHEAPFLCDWRGWGNHTCDAPICAKHAFEVARDKHLCSIHVEAYRLWLRDVQGIAY